MRKDLALEKVEEAMDSSQACMRDSLHPMSDYPAYHHYYDYFDYFRILLQRPVERIGVVEYQNGFYVGDILNGLPHGIGMFSWKCAEAFEGYKQMNIHIGEWEYGERSGEGLHFSMIGDEPDWFVEFAHYVHDAQKGRAVRSTYARMLELTY